MRRFIPENEGDSATEKKKIRAFYCCNGYFGKKKFEMALYRCKEPLEVFDFFLNYFFISINMLCFVYFVTFFLSQKKSSPLKFVLCEVRNIERKYW